MYIYQALEVIRKIDGNTGQIKPSLAAFQNFTSKVKSLVKDNPQANGANPSDESKNEEDPEQTERIEGLIPLESAGKLIESMRGEITFAKGQIGEESQAKKPINIVKEYLEHFRAALNDDETEDIELKGQLSDALISSQQAQRTKHVVDSRKKLLECVNDRQIETLGDEVLVLPGGKSMQANQQVVGVPRHVPRRSSSQTRTRSRRRRSLGTPSSRLAN